MQKLSSDTCIYWGSTKSWIEFNWQSKNVVHKHAIFTENKSWLACWLQPGSHVLIAQRSREKTSHMLAASCVIGAITSSIFVSTYCSRCSPTPGQTTAGTLMCRFMWLFILDHTFSIGFSMGEYGPRRLTVRPGKSNSSSCTLLWHGALSQTKTSWLTSTPKEQRWEYSAALMHM